MPQYNKTIRWPFSIRFWETGRIYAKGNIQNGLRQGLWTFWYRSGKKQMAGAYTDGVKQHEWTKWWENGKKASQGDFIDGKMHGLWTDWFDNGEIAQQSHWANGQRVGQTTVWDKETQKIASQKEFDESQGPVKGYTLMTDRDMAYALASAQKAGLSITWTRLAGKTVSKYIEPWHGALWLLALVPAFKVVAPRLGVFAIPGALAAASLLSLGIIFTLQIHDKLTRPDFGEKKIKG